MSDERILIDLNEVFVSYFNLKEASDHRYRFGSDDFRCHSLMKEMRKEKRNVRGKTVAPPLLGLQFPVNELNNELIVLTIKMVSTQCVPTIKSRDSP